MERINNKIFDEERALYGRNGLCVTDCSFDGPADGESAFKECTDIIAQSCFFNLRYPFWHDHGLKIFDSELTELCRAALWYSSDIAIKNTKLHGIKALRECRDITMSGCDIASPEFGWSAADVSMTDCDAQGEYFMLRAENLTLDNVRFKGKYSFQYIHDTVIENSVLDTKDAFWHSKHVTVRNSVVKGEYLAWYSDHLTLENCKIIGTQPLCYCTNLRLINCEMYDTDLCFEKSDVDAVVVTPVKSIKNPRSGRIVVPAVEEIIHDDPAANGEIVVCKCVAKCK